MSRTWLAFGAGALLLSVAADSLLLSRAEQGEFWWSDLWGFFAVFGFVSCVALIVVAKALGRYWLQRTEDYYESGDRDG